MESPSRGEHLLLFLHRTSLSVEGEWGTILPEVLAKSSASPLSGGVQILAPDRPCHGYSPCLASSRSKEGLGNVAWLSGLLSSRASPLNLVLVASGREAGRQAFRLSRKRHDAVHIVLISPRLESTRLASATSGAQFFEKLKSRAGDMTIRDVADTALWTALTAEDQDFSDRAAATILLPKGSVLALFYLQGDREVIDVTDDLGIDSKGITVKARWSKARMATAEAHTDELWEMMGANQAPAEEEEEEIDDTL